MGHKHRRFNNNKLKHIKNENYHMNQWNKNGKQFHSQDETDHHFQGSKKNLLADLSKRGLTIHSIVPDGNCLFRSCADQLFGNQNRYKEVRHNAVDYMKKHKNDYIPFMDEDTQPFDEYVNRMSHNGIWGGDLEINAISNYYKCNVIVFQDSRPNLELQKFPKDTRVLQLAYFGSCHYNSVHGKNPIALSETSNKDNIVIRADEEEKLEKLGKLERKKEERRKRREEMKKKREEEMKKRKEEEEMKKRKEEEEMKRKEEEEMKRKEEEMKRKEEEKMKKKKEEEEKQRKEEEKQRKEEEEKQRKETTNKTTTEAQKKREKKERQKCKQHQQFIVTRNFFILKEVEEAVTKEQHHHKHHLCCHEWNGDLPFNELIEPEIQSKLLWIENEKELRNVLHFLTMKCPCKSGSYYKYCCYPKIKACIKRKRYYLNKFRV